ncbi:MAG: RNA polymerase sigma factor [Clostridia bacterium]|nr:RNA polymerase sigma factor [Clostridia bacterium]
MTEKEALLHALENEMVSKIYGFCRMKLKSVSDAEDLSQDICLEVLKSIHSGKKIDNINAFVWTVSNHMFFNLLRKRRYGTVAYIDDATMSEDDIEGEFILSEQKILLRRELSLMSYNYRRAVVMHYFDNMSCEEIGRVLGKSEGTVKWWLHDARQAIEKGMNTMRTYGEKSYRPGNLFVSCTGNPGSDMEPVSCAKRKSAQNILLCAYKEPITVTELCEELGISAPYIEDEVDYLCKNQLMKEVSKGKYQTDFVILPGRNPDIGNKIYAHAFPDFYKKLINYLESKRKILSSPEFNTAGFEWSRLLWVYIHIFSEFCVKYYRYYGDIKYIKYNDIPLRPNGGKWIAFGFDNSDTSPKEFMPYHGWDGPVHKFEPAYTQGFCHYWSGIDSLPYFDLPSDVFALCRQIIKGEVKIEELNEEQRYLFSIAIEKQLFVNENGVFKQNYYYVNKAERREIEKMAQEFAKSVQDITDGAYQLVLKEYESTVPKHLHWQMGNFLSNALTILVTCSLYEAEKEGILSVPTDKNKYWLSLFASE